MFCVICFYIHIMCAYITVQIIHIAHICNSCKDITKKSLTYGKKGKIYIQDYLENIFN